MAKVMPTFCMPRVLKHAPPSQQRTNVRMKAKERTSATCRVVLTIEMAESSVTGYSGSSSNRCRWRVTKMATTTLSSSHGANGMTPTAKVLPQVKSSANFSQTAPMP